jgi:lambda family phage portal protein
MGTASPPKWKSAPAWMGGGESARRFESAGTDRLNSSHWTYAADESVNAWLGLQLATIRGRAAYEARQNGVVLGMINTHADDIVGNDGPTLQVLSESDAYNQALEELWVDWFSAPTPRPNMSGAALLKLWIRSLWRNGEFLGQLVSDPDADGPVMLRIQPLHPRLLGTPIGSTGDPALFMGIRINRLGRPVQYHIAESSVDGAVYGVEYAPVPADLVIHEFVAEEEGQLRGIPWLNTALQPAADLRDYDDQVQDAARQIADQSGILYTEHPDAQPWLQPETVDIQRRTIKTAPPGWKPFIYPSTQPPVQYPDYRAERQRELGRPVGMPLMMIRLDCARYNYSSARLETQNYYRAVSGLQSWLSGTQRSTGMLSRLVDSVAAEARFTIPALRNRPRLVRYQWTWPSRPHVDPSKEATAEETALGTRTLTLTDALAARGRDLETHVAMLQREQQVFADAGLVQPAWMTGPPKPAPVNANGAADPEDDAEENAEAMPEDKKA